MKKIFFLILLVFLYLSSSAQVVIGGPYWLGSTVSTVTDDWAQIGSSSIAVPAPPQMKPNLDIFSIPNEDRTRTAINIGRFRTNQGTVSDNIVQIYDKNPAPYGTGVWEPIFIIDPYGKVVIGLDPGTYASSDNYKLFVEKGILTEKVKVAIHTSADWSDYVFDDSYKLMPIHELENYLKAHKHLPNVPSASDVVKDGIDLGKMDATLLQKVEELTLYMLELKKENTQLKQRIEKLEQ